MTTTVYDRSYDAAAPRSSYDLAEQHTRVRWSAVFAGLAVSLALWVLLYSFGLAAGLTAIDPNDTSSARIAGIGTGVWSLLTPLLALFAGGYVAARVSGVFERREAALHGLILWSAVTLVGLFFVGSVLSSVVGGALDVGKAAATTAAQASAQGAAASGTSPTTAAGDAASAARQKLDELQPQIAQRAEQAKAGALSTADRAGKAFWGASIALLLGLLASVLGAAAGVRKRHVEERGPVATTYPAGTATQAF